MNSELVNKWKIQSFVNSRGISTLYDTFLTLFNDFIKQTDAVPRRQAQMSSRKNGIIGSWYAWYNTEDMVGRRNGDCESRIRS